MQHSTFSWSNEQGQTIAAQTWAPDSQAKAVLLLVHGLGEHISRYADWAAFFCQQNFAVIGNDRVGHGRSEGKRGHVAKYEYLLDEVKQLIQAAQTQFPGLPIFLYGHSMGGGIVLNYLLRRGSEGLKGIIATGPAIQLAFEPSAFLLALGKLMRNIYPGFSQKNQLDTDKLCRDPKIVEAYLQDPLVHDRVSSEAGLGLIEYGHYALEQAEKAKNFPLLLMHGEADAITSAKGTQAFAQKLNSEQARLKIWEGMYHEIHNEPEKQTVWDYTLAWLEEQLG